MCNNISFTKFDKEHSVLHVNDRLHFLLTNSKRHILEQEISHGAFAIDDLCHELELRGKLGNKGTVGLQDFQLKMEIISASVMDKLVLPFRFLFNKNVMMLAFVLAFCVCSYGMWQDYILYTKNKMPLLVVSVVFVMMCIFHEIGHSSACKHYQVPVNGIGFGIAAYRPVMFADVSGAWYLTLNQRLIVNIGGIYFQLLYTSVFFLWGILSSNPLLYNLGNLLLFSVCYQFIPFFRTDGYWILSDFLSEPNLYKKSCELAKEKIISKRKRLGCKEKKYLVYFFVTEGLVAVALLWYVFFNYTYLLSIPLCTVNFVQNLSLGNFDMLLNLQMKDIWNVLFLYIICKKLLVFSISKFSKALY